MYLLHPKHANDPWHYVQAFLLLQQDIRELFVAVEPADTNGGTYSHRIQQLLMRCCVEIEANFTAILAENGWAGRKRDLTIKQYRLIEKSHRLSSYRAMIPGWRGAGHQRQPFSAWATPADPLTWYQAYNSSKHDRHGAFEEASLNALMESYCGLAIVLAAQFHTQDYSPAQSGVAWSGRGYWGNGSPDFEPSIGDFLRIAFPRDWPSEELYDFEWQALAQEDDPFTNFDHGRYA